MNDRRLTGVWEPSPSASSTAPRSLHRPAVALFLGLALLLLFTRLLVQGDTGCPADPFEPNESASQARQISPGTYPDLSLCPNDQDWFRVDLGRNDRISATIAFPLPRGDLDLYLLDETGRRVLDAGTHTAPAGEEHVVYTTTEPTHVYLWVTGYKGASNTYTLTVQLTRTDDIFEPNDDMNHAPHIRPGTYPGLIILPGNPDFFAIDVPDNTIVQLVILFSHERGDLDMWLTDRTGHAVASSTSSTDNERIIYPAAVGGTYYIYVAGYQNASNTYTLIYRMEQVGACEDDSFAPNASRDAAAPLDFGTYALTLCPDTEDWFRVHAPGGGVLRLLATFEHMLGDLDMRWWQEGRPTPIASSEGIGNREIITRAFPSPEDVFVEIYGHDLSLGVPYTLTADWATFTPTPTSTPTPTPTPTATPTPTPTLTPTATPTPTPTNTPTPTPTPTPPPSHNTFIPYIPLKEGPSPLP